MPFYPHIRKPVWLLATLLVASLLVLPNSARAALVVAVVATQPEAPVGEVLEGFRDQFAHDGESLELTVYHLTGDDLDNYGQIANILDNRPQLILVLGSQALSAVAALKTDIPVVFGMVLTEHLPPGAKNITGVLLDFPVASQLEWLHRLLPRAKNVGVIYHPAENAGRIREAQEVAARLGLQLLARPIASPRELPAALDSLANSSDVLWGLSDRMVINTQTARSLLLFSFRNRIPFFGLSAAWVKAGALFALERDYRDIGRQCAELSEKILAGAAPASLTPLAPRRAFYVLNRRTAEQMKIDFPAAVLRDARKVY